MTLTATHLKQNLFQVLDTIHRNRQPVQIENNGHFFKIIPDDPNSKLDNLEPHDAIVGDPESIIYTDWAKEWNEGNNL